MRMIIIIINPEFGQVHKFKRARATEIIAISHSERFVRGEYKGRTCTVLRSGGMDTEQIFTAQSYCDVLISLQSWLKEEGKRWR